MALQWIGYLKQSGWMDLLKIGGVAGFVSSVVTLGWNAVRDGRMRRRESRHTALTMAIALECYAREAMMMMHRVDWARKEAGRMQHSDPLRGIGLPDFEFPEAVGWTWLRHKVAAQLREFPARLHTARQSLLQEWECAEPPEYGDAVAFECAGAAKRALELASLVRTQHGVAPRNPDARDVGLEADLTGFLAGEATRRETLRAQQHQVVAERAGRLQAD
ncbi:hypothetical protein CY652_09975 [Burkholderia sp. WAC0059]|uniref:hypothetical protein n=1 Tax=Burkholderia sp. WAC0059 TaxID=2066022 RepID=UPI000C7E930E|nr:hypothetical protein [Burkholderia sp. WAC0059]PLZ02446.1 hypothetical protein CY652_09975 [Burkholderia sp. WAC0059]